MVLNRVRFCEETKEDTSGMTLEELEEDIKKWDEESKKLTEWPEM